MAAEAPEGPLAQELESTSSRAPGSGPEALPLPSISGFLMKKSTSEDPVVRELDVFLTDHLDPNLGVYIVQFPLRPQYARAPDVVDARFKPQHELLELGVAHGAMDDPLRHLSTKVAQGSNLGLGLLRDGAFHITPVSEVLQMRPAFASSSANVTRGTRQWDTAPSDDEDDSENGDDVNPAASRNEAKPVLQKVVMHKKESERVISARLQSYSYCKAQEEAEEAQTLEVHPIDSAASQCLIEENLFFSN
jgi:hypothetical protein